VQSITNENEKLMHKELIDIGFFEYCNK